MISLLIVFLLILSISLTISSSEIKKSFNYSKNYYNGKTFEQQFKESFKKNFANTGTEMIDYLKKRPYYCTNPDLSHHNLFTDIIKNQITFDLNYLCDFYFALEDKQDAIIICLCPLKYLLNEIKKRTFYVDYHVGVNYHCSVNKLQASEGTFDNFPITETKLNCLKQGIVMLNFRSHIFGSFKIPVYCEEDYEIDQKVILTTKNGNKCFVFDCFPEY